MPVYEYQCCVCSKTVELWQSMNDAPLSTCPDCSGEMKKLISLSAFALKGGGWYADGYSSGSAGKSCDAGKCAAGESPACAAKSPSCGCG
ncbi:MAG: FmdB family zinc ribbon protein [Thermodesulfobacteriota bacterium]